MSELNRELTEFLNRNDNSDTQSLLPTTIKDLKAPQISGWFKSSSSNGAGSSPQDEASTSSGSSWFSSSESDPIISKLVSFSWRL